MEDKDVVMIPYIVHEGDMARQERTIKRLWILCVLLVILLCGSFRAQSGINTHKRGKMAL